MANELDDNYHSADELIETYQKKIKKMQKIGRLQTPSKIQSNTEILDKSNYPDRETSTSNSFESSDK